MDKVASSGAQRPQPTQQAQEPRPTPRNAQARSYSRLSPDQQRAESITKKPKAAVKTLGSKIDVYA